MDSNKKFIFSGIQPTNSLTIGNYFGVIKNFVKLQNEANLFIFIADLHALSAINPILNINQNSINLVKYLIASGLDLNKVVLFRQSDVVEHLELFNILLNNTTIGELSRMTQYKDKSTKCKQANGTDFIPTGLLTYPVLMAADILLYNPDLVVVGLDQKQHLELARNLAERMNNKYHSEFFKLPGIYMNEVGAKIMDLQNPTKKMSKSTDNLKGTIFLNDNEQDIKTKINSSLTDNLNKVEYNWDNQPGISNLISIYACLTNKSIKAIEDEFKNIKNYGEFKKAIIDALSAELNLLNERYKQISDEEVEKILLSNKQKAQSIASERLKQIYKMIGLR